MLFCVLLAADFAFAIDEKRKMLQFKVRVMFLFYHLHNCFVSEFRNTSALLADDLHTDSSAGNQFVLGMRLSAVSGISMQNLCQNEHV